MDRKTFIKGCGIACIGGIALSTLIEGCASSNYYAKSIVAYDRLIIPKSEFQFAKDGKIIFRTYVLARVQQIKYPIIIFRQTSNAGQDGADSTAIKTARPKQDETPGGLNQKHMGGLTLQALNEDRDEYSSNMESFDGYTYTALLMECTHKGCELRANGEFLICPCHGSEFSSAGVVQSPPAEKNLKSYTVTEDRDQIYIQL